MMNVMRIGKRWFCFIKVAGHDRPEVVIENIRGTGVSWNKEIAVLLVKSKLSISEL